MQRGNKPRAAQCGDARTPQRSPLAVTRKEREALYKGALYDMKERGFKTPEELIDYYDGKRGY